MDDKETTLKYLTAEVEYHEKKVGYLIGRGKHNELIKHWNAMGAYKNAINEIKK